MPPRPRPKSRYVCSGQVAEAVLQIMEDGPQPMIDMKPSKKNPNGADQFRSEHLAEYENYESQGRRDGNRHVDNHNAAYPKLIDELERRRSAARTPATAVKRRTTNQTFFDPHCHLCKKLKMAIDNKKRSPRTKHRNDNRRRKPEKKSRVSKPRKAQRGTRCTYKLSKIRKSIGVQYCNQYTRIPGLKSNDAGTTPQVDEHGMNEIYFSNCDDQQSISRHSQATNPPGSHNVSKSDVLTQNPDTSSNSLSSYNSNMSLEQEPMVSR